MRKIFSNLVCFSESLNFKDCWKPNCCHGAVGHFGQCIFELLQYWCWKSFCNSKLTRLKKLLILSLQDNKKWSLLKTRNIKHYYYVLKKRIIIAWKKIQKIITFCMTFYDQNFYDENFFDSKLFLTINFFFDNKLSLTTNFLWQQTFFDNKLSLTTNFLLQQTFFDNKLFLTTNFLWQQTFFGNKRFFDNKLFMTTNFFWQQTFF